MSGNLKMRIADKSRDGSLCRHIMIKSLNSNFSCSQELAQFLGFNVVGNFCLNNSQFLIISLERFREDNPTSTLSLSDETAYSSVIGRFEVDGQSYLIVKAKEFFKNAELNPIALLTSRELQIATLVAQGCSNKQMANLLRISKWTISTHLRRIFIKLGVDSRAAMVYRCASLISLCGDFNASF